MADRDPFLSVAGFVRDGEHAGVFEEVIEGGYLFE
jgi:hypothetical protein